MKFKCLLTGFLAILGQKAWGMEGYDLTDPAQNRYLSNQQIKAGVLEGELTDLRGSRTLGADEYIILKAPVARGAVGGIFIPSSIPKASLDVPVLLFENSGVNHQEVRARGKTGPSESFTGFQDHGSAMASLINQIAPRGDVDVEYLENVLDALSRADIINFSNSYDLSRLPKEQLIGKVVVKAVGNSREDASWTDAVGENFEHVLFAGNMTKDRRFHSTSSYPGMDPRVQSNFLWVLASDILTATGPQGGAQFGPKTGTSLAASMLSGVLADFKSRFPGFTMPQIKQILLRSADKTWTQTFGYDDGVVVGATPSSSRLVRADYKPEVWGAGVLNYGRALRVAKTMKEYATGDRLALPLALGVVFDQEQQTQKKAAIQIQSAWKGRTLSATPKPELLTIDESRRISYAKAPGTPSPTYEVPDDFDERVFIGAPPRPEVAVGTRPEPRMKRVGGVGSRVDDTASVPPPVAIRAPSVPAASFAFAYNATEPDITTLCNSLSGMISLKDSNALQYALQFMESLPHRYDGGYPAYFQNVGAMIAGLLRLPALNSQAVQEILRLAFDKNYLESYQLRELLSSSYANVVRPAWRDVKSQQLCNLLSDLTGADIPDWFKTSDNVQKISSLLNGARILGLLGEMLELARGVDGWGNQRSPAATSIFEGLTEDSSETEIMECVRRNIGVE